MKILVTGANGFIGKHLVKRLIRDGHEIDVLVRREEECFKGMNIHRIHSCDITHPFKIAEHFDVVIHLAAYNITNVGEIDSSIYHRVNVQGTEHVLSAVNTRRFIFLSTTKVYGKSAGSVTEDHGIAPVNPYEQSKRQAEEICVRLKGNKELVILRATNVFGPGQPKKAVIPIFFQRAMTDEAIKVFAPQGSCLQFLYVDDLVLAIERAALAPLVEGIFNVAPSEMVQLKDLALRIKEICHSSSEISFSNEASEDKTEISSNKIRQEIGWQSSLTLEQGLQRYYEFVKGQ